MRKPLSGTIFSALILLSILILGLGCTKTPVGGTNITVPSVVTLNVISSVTNVAALSGGVVTNANNGTISTNGVCWSSTNSLPTVADSKTSDAININGFTSNVTGLTAGTKYYLRAYASDEAGVGYGGVLTFTTNATAATINTTVSTIAGSSSGAYGFVNGAGASALFSGPLAIALNPVTGNFYISDNFNNTIRIMTPAGVVTNLTQSALGYLDGPLSSALFYGVASITFDAAGNTYIADLGNNRIRKITTAGVVSTLAGNGLNGYVDGAGTIAEFSSPSGVAVDAAGIVYVADRGDNLIREVSTTNAVSSLAGGIAIAGISQTNAPGYYDGTGPIALFNSPCSVAVDAQGNLYVADINNKAVRVVATSTGVVTTLAGDAVQKYLLGSPVALTCDAAGDVYIVDQTGRILEVTAARTLYVLAGAANTAGYVDGPGATARFNSPSGIAVDASGNVYVTDFNNNVIRKITVSIH